MVVLKAAVLEGTEQWHSSSGCVWATAAPLVPQMAQSLSKEEVAGSCIQAKQRPRNTSLSFASLSLEGAYQTLPS